jgi:4-hydroxy-3-methylbut-2-enyl diphosphate reductase
VKVILAEPRGFCAGVNMAIASLDTALRVFGSPTYVYHEIVHNKVVVDEFRKRGAIFVDDLSTVPEGAPVLFSAHGVSPEVRRIASERRLQAIDATCPLVTKVHLEAVRYVKEGYRIILIGHEGHDEVVGVMGEALGAVTLVQSEDDVGRLSVPADAKVAYLTQTTLSVDDANRIIERLKARYPQIVGPRGDDICYATQNRQEAVRRLATEADVVLVVGSQNSSNSQRLREIAQAGGVRAELIDGASDIHPSWFRGDETVLLTAGASAPEAVVQRCIDYLKNHFGASVEGRALRQEQVRFPLPKALRAASISGQSGVPRSAARGQGDASRRRGLTSNR